METEITKLRNLMTPLINYFHIIQHNKLNDYDETKRIIEMEREQATLNIPEIRRILNNIPDDACENKTNIKLCYYCKIPIEKHKFICDKCNDLFKPNQY